MRVLILGGYGAFGARLARLLARDGRLTLLIAGRSKARAQALCDRLDGAAERIPFVFDRNKDFAERLVTARAEVLVDAAGPFQSYGKDPYRLVRACIEAGVSYLDLADAAGFVAGIGALDKAAKGKDVFALSGLSTFPALSAAVVGELSKGLDRVEAVRAGVAPSPHSGVGQNVVRAIASYAGKPLPVVQGGEETIRPAIIDSLRRTIAVPGGLPMRNTLFTLAETPDLVLGKTLYRAKGRRGGDLRELWTGAGPRPELLHRMLRGLAWLVRLRLVPSLSPAAEVLHWGSRTFRWGEHRGGMFVEVEGRGGGREVKRAWHLVAEGDDGPFIPSIGAAAVILKLADGKAPKRGARSAAGEVTLADYKAVFASLHIESGVWTEPGHHRPLYCRALGSAWERLPDAIRDLHTVRTDKTVRGEAEVERGRGLIARVIGWVMGLPAAGSAVPVEVTFTRRPDGGEVWKRTFAGKSFASDQVMGKGRYERLIVERFGPVALGLAAVVEGERLVLHIRRATLFGMPLPEFLTPRLETFEEVDRQGRFRFDDRVSMPIAGLIVHYRGWLV